MKHSRIMDSKCNLIEKTSLTSPLHADMATLELDSPSTTP